MRLVPWRKTMLFRLFVFGDEATTFGVSSTKFQLPNNFPHTPLFSRYLLPEKGRKNHPPHFIYRRLPCKNKKGNPLFADAHRGSQKEKDTFFYLSGLPNLGDMI